MLLGRRSSSDKSTKSTKSGDETAVQKGDDILDPQSNNPTGVRDKPVNGLIQKSSDIESTEWVESAKASLADKFELAAGKAQHFELAEDEEWHALMQDWKKDLNGMPQEQLVGLVGLGVCSAGRSRPPRPRPSRWIWMQPPPVVWPLLASASKQASRVTCPLRCLDQG